MPALVLGPLLRYVDATQATVWVETDGACTVRVLEREARTFHVAGHHYAIVVLDGLEPGGSYPYTVTLDGTPAWPQPGGGYPDSIIRTIDPHRPLTLAFGSCRVTAPNEPPYTLDKHRNRDGMGVDALHGLARRMREQPVDAWPDLLLFVGDQVYADEVSPQTLEFLRSRRDLSVPPGNGVADFEEYTRLYEEAWSEPTIRWLLSTMPTAMIFDDHDIHDDWNTSAVWRRRIQATPWWSERIAGGLSSYWLYQHLGNISPVELAGDPLLAQLQEVDDGAPLLHEFALRADSEADGGPGTRWSYRRDFGRVRLLVIDSRCGRVLDGRREMVDEEEWRWIEQQAHDGEVDHLLVAASLPFLLPPAIHHLEGWNEAVCAGAWGRRAAVLGEKLRQGADLEHWASFRSSFDKMMALVAEVGAGRRGTAPATIGFLSGDVHFSYVSDVDFPAGSGVQSVVYQAVCSPLRNPIQRRIQLADRFARTMAGRLLGRALARSAGVRDPEPTWSIRHGPWFDNDLATVRMSGREACVEIERSVPGDGSDPRLEPVARHDVTARRDENPASGADLAR